MAHAGTGLRRKYITRHVDLQSLQNFDSSLTPDEMHMWLAKTLNRQPESVDFYNTGKIMYQNGLFQGAAKLLKLYVEAPGHELPGRHLLGYALYRCGESAAASEQLTQCVNSGFDSDWQLLTEIEVDLAKREEKATS